MRKAKPVTYETVRELGLAMKDVVEATSYGTPALKVKKKFLLRLKEDGESIAIKISFDDREMLMAANPDAFYLTDHYRPHPAMLIHLSRVAHDQLADVLKMAYDFVSGSRAGFSRRRKS